MDCPLSGHSQPAYHPSPGFLGSREVMPQQCNFISAPQSDVADGCFWEPADQNWVSRTTACGAKNGVLIKVKAIGVEAPISSQPHTLCLQLQHHYKHSSSSDKKRIDQISYLIPPAQLNLCGNSCLITALSSSHHVISFSFSLPSAGSCFR